MNDKIYIHYVLNEKPVEDRSKSANIHTHGMENYGLPNICTTIRYSPEYASWLLNTIADTIIEAGQNYHFDTIHAFDEPDGEGGYKPPYIYFTFQKVKCCEEICYLVIETDENGTPLDLLNLLPTRWGYGIEPCD